jgi:Immunity protein Imm1
MTATEPTPLQGEQTGQVTVDVTTYATPEDLTRRLLAANPATGASVGRVWSLRAGIEDGLPTLAVGMRGEVGALEWIDHAVGGRFVPVDGLNPNWAEYFVWGGIDQGMPPQAELPVQRVLEAVSEFVRTRWRPTSVDWTPETA